MIELINRNNRSQHLYINQSTEKNKLISKGPIMLTGLITLHTNSHHRSVPLHTSDEGMSTYGSTLHYHHNHHSDKMPMLVMV